MDRSTHRPDRRERRSPTRWAGLAAAAVLITLAWGSLDGVAQTPAGSTAAPPAPVRTQVHFEALITPEDGPTGQQRMESRRIQAVGRDAVTFLTAGTGNAATLCAGGFSLEQPDAPAYYAWRFETRVIDATEARTTLAVSWTRWRQGEADATGARTITLQPGDDTILDFVPAPAGFAARCASLEVRVAADPVPQDEPRPHLTYDLWLSQEGPLGSRWSHQQVRGRSSDLVTFTVPPLAWTVRGVPLTDPTDRRAVRLGVKGSLRATLDPTGFVEVSVTADRTLAWCGRGGGDGGRQSYRARLGEAVALVLPDPTLTTEAPTTACPGATGPPVQVKGASALLDFGRFFSGNHASLTIVVSRAGSSGGPVHR